MYFKTRILAILATASTTVAEFAIITTPLPTNLNVLTDLSAYKSSILSQVSSGLASLTGDPAAISSAASAHKGLVAFAATATYSIPPKVTEAGALETFSTTPVWYSALPTNVKAYYDAFNKEVQGLIDQAILGERRNETESETQSAGSTPTGTSGGAGAKETGAAARGRSAVGVVGAGIAAAVVGVLAL